MSTTIIRLAGTAFAIALLASCSSSSPTSSSSSIEDNADSRMWINDHKAGCQGLDYQTCMLTRTSEQEPWTYFYDAIEGFDFEWGYRYQLRVRVTDVINPPADASSKHYALVELVQKTKVDEESFFQFSLMPNDALINRVSATHFDLGSDTSFNCDVATCDQVESLLTQDMAMVLNFQHAIQLSGKLRLQGILCSDSLSQFYESCLGQP